MKEYTITLNESDVEKVMRALHSRNRYFRRKATEKINDCPEIDMEIAENYKRLSEMFKAL